MIYQSVLCKKSNIKFHSENMMFKFFIYESLKKKVPLL